MRWLERLARHLESGGVGSDQWFNALPGPARALIWAITLTIVLVLFGFVVTFLRAIVTVIAILIIWAITQAI